MNSGAGKHDKTNLTLSSLSILLFAAQVNSAPLFNSTDCTEAGAAANWINLDSNGSNSPPSGYSAGDPIYFYIESDIGEEIRNCVSQSPSNTSNILGLNNADANEQAIKSIISAADSWNREGLPSTLQYGGTLNRENADDACNLMIQTPAVFIRFENRCKEPASNPNTTCENQALATATVEYIIGCDNTSEIIIWGDPNSPTGCIEGSAGANPPHNYTLGTLNSYTSDDKDISSLMVHEFGHILGLGHRFEPNVGPFDASVMSQGDSDEPWVRRHLHPWDMDCSNTPETGSIKAERRVIEYRYLRFNSSGIQTPGVVSEATDIKKGMYSGGYLGSTSSSITTYGLHYGSWMRTSFAGVDGFFSFSNRPAYNITYPIRDLYMSPSFFSPLEKNGVNQGHRVHYNSVTFQSSDPPRVSYVRSDNFFVSGTTGTVSSCNNLACGTGDRETLESHLPLVSAWDDEESQTVFVSVDTQRSSVEFGDIQVHPGYNGTSNTNLNPPDEIDVDAGTLPTPAYTGFIYRGKTDVAPALTCADDQSTFTEGNCMIAWVDNGVSDGTILYTYFETNGSNINWSPNVYELDAGTVSGLSAAYFANQMWLAYKTDDGDIEYVTSNSVGNWSLPVGVGRTEAIEAPTWLYVPHLTKEAMLIWIESDSI